MAKTDHRCDDRCVCPIHGTHLYYSPAEDDHACQDPQCKYAHGVNDVEAAERETWTNSPFPPRPVRPGEQHVNGLWDRMLDAIRFDEIVRQESRRTILCEPHRVDQIRAAVEARGAGDILTVRASAACPEGQLIVIDPGAIDAQWNEWVQGLAKKPIRWRAHPDD